MSHPPIPDETERVAHEVIQAAFRVHKALGPGLLESAYEKCLCHELNKGGLSFQSQLEVPLIYDGMKIESGFRIDILVEEILIVELKAVEKVLPIDKAQVITYLKLSKLRLALLLNFNEALLKDGLQRIVI